MSLMRALSRFGSTSKPQEEAVYGTPAEFDEHFWMIVEAERWNECDCIECAGWTPVDDDDQSNGWIVDEAQYADNELDARYDRWEA
jgi:hypothetical protein